MNLANPRNVLRFISSDHLKELQDSGSWWRSVSVRSNLKNLYITTSTSMVVTNRIRKKSELRRKKQLVDVASIKKQKVPFVPKLHTLNEREKSLLQLIELTRQAKIRPGFRHYLDMVRLYKTKKSPVLDLDGNINRMILVRGPSCSHEHRQYVQFLLQQQAYIQNRNGFGDFPLVTFDLQHHKQKNQEGMFIPSKREIKRFQDLQSDNHQLLESVLCFYIVEHRTKSLIPVFLPHFMERAGEMLHNKYNDLFARRPVCQEHFFYLVFESALLHRLVQLKNNTFQKYFASPRTTTNTKELQIESKSVIFMLEHRLETPESVMENAESGEWLGAPIIIHKSDVNANISQQQNSEPVTIASSLDSVIEESCDLEWIFPTVVTRSMGPLLPSLENTGEKENHTNFFQPGNTTTTSSLLSVFEECKDECEWIY